MVLQVLLNRAEFGLSLEQAVGAPRLHHQWKPDELRLERGFPAGVVQSLEKRGHKIKALDDGMGEVNAAERDPAAGRVLGAADPRRAGRAVAW
jgi:gamma-glutamyltranspeptidase/glutathione hydrolase